VARAARARRLHAGLPKIQIKLYCSNPPVGLREERFNFATRVSFAPPAHVVARRLAANRSVLCAASAYLKPHGSPRRIDNLPRHECVIFPALAPRGVWTFRRDGRKQSVPVSGAFETDEMDAVRAAVVAGLGVSPLPVYLAVDDLRAGRLLPLLRRFQVVPESAIYLVYLPNRTPPSRVHAFIDSLAERFGPTPSWEESW
jgi:DNA-binding transcriptional LysR family regulator